MLSITLLFTSLLVGFAAAQTNTTFNPNLINPTLKNQWCQGERANCPTLCGGQANTRTNRCDGASLTYECTCANGTGPADIDQYQDTLPNHICQATFAQCRTANPGSDSCITCGTLKPSDVEAIPVSTSSAAASSSATAAATTPAASPSAMTTGTNGARKVEGAVGGLAAGVLAALVL